MTASRVPVSVVIPCFRCAKTIERAVASIARQSTRAQEVILVDDGNDDDTPAVLQQLQAAYPVGWISVLTLNVNQGAATARNNGWAKAKGHYVAFLDADDTWHPEKLAIQYGYMNANTKLVMTGHCFIQTEGDKAPLFPESTGAIQSHPVKPWKVLLKNPFITPSIMVRADAPLHFPRGQRYMEDHLLLMQMALRGLPMSVIDRPLAAIHKHRYGQAGLSSNMQAMHLAEIENLQTLEQAGDISRWTSGVLLIYVKLKFMRRKALVAMRERVEVTQQRGRRQ